MMCTLYFVRSRPKPSIKHEFPLKSPAQLDDIPRYATTGPLITPLHDLQSHWSPSILDAFSG